MTVGDRIKMLREQSGVTQSELAVSLKTTKQTIHKYEAGIVTNIPLDKLAAIAKHFDVTPAYIMGWDEYAAPMAKNIIPMPSTQRLPIIGSIACGVPILADENIEDYINVPDGVKADFCLRCEGDSMINARINDGDIVFIRQQCDVDNGQIAAVLIGDEATLKRVYKSHNKVMLVAENSAYLPLVYTNDELDQMRILGKAVAFLSAI